MFLLFLGLLYFLFLWWDKTAAVYIHHGDEQASQQNYRNALENYDFALSLEWLNKDLAYITHLKKGHIYRARRHLENAQEEYSRASKILPKRTEAYLDLGKISYMQGNYQVAQSYFDRVLKLGSHDSEAIIGEVKSLIKLGDTAEAQRILRTLLDQDPKHAEGLLYQGILSFYWPQDEQDVAAQISMFEEVLVHGDDPKVSEKAERAISALREISSSEDNLNFVQVSIGYLLSEIGEPTLALGKINPIVTEDPDNRDAWMFKGYSHYLLHNYPAAISSLKTALEKDPENGFTHYLMAKSFYASGQIEDAKREYDHAIELGFDNAAIRKDSALLCIDQGEYQVALDHYTQAIQFDPGNMNILKEAFWVAVEKQKDYQRANEFAERFVKQYPNTADSFALLSISYLYLNDLKAADTSYKKALEIDPSSASAYYAKSLVCAGFVDTSCSVQSAVRAIDLDTEGDIGTRAAKLYDFNVVQ